MEAPLTMPLTAVNLRRRYLRACELKQAVNWERIVECFQKWARGLDIEMSAIVRVEGVEQLKEAAIKAWETPEIWRKWVAMANVDALLKTAAAKETWSASERTTARHAQIAARVWTTKDARAAMIRWILHPDNKAEHLGVSAGLNLAWLSTIAIGAATWGISTESFKKWYPFFEAFEAGAFSFFIVGDRIAVCTLPTMVSTDDQGRLHSASGPAFVWLNDIRDYYWHGVYVESYVVEHPERITLTDLEMEMSQYVRRVKIEQFSRIRSRLGMPPIASVTTEELKERYKRACGLKQTVNWGKIVECFQQWAAAMKIDASAIVRVEGVEQLKAAATILAESDTSRIPHGSRASDVAFDAKIVQEVMLEANMNVANAALAASQSWHTRVYRAMGKPWSQWIASLMCLKAIGALELGISAEFLIWYPLFEAFEAGAFCFYITDRGIEVCTFPSVVKVDERNRLHSASGPAFVWLNDIQEYYWHGNRVESYVVDNPERITVADIEAESNVEVRRVKIERFGLARYLVKSGAQEIHRDDYGMLYRKQIPGDEPLVMVKVVNATPEPDGSFKDYFMRVPPTMQTAREAVAWTFGKSPNDYDPEKET
jgi:hypothetical protein